jgi:hypothetical protein
VWTSSTPRALSTNPVTSNPTTTAFVVGVDFLVKLNTQSDAIRQIAEENVDDLLPHACGEWNSEC